MNHKTRSETKEGKILRILNVRSELESSVKQYYLNLIKGFEGEKMWDVWLENRLEEERLVLSDLLFEVNHTTFQIDSLIISQNTVYLFEVKNFEGDHFYKSEEFYKLTTTKEIKNPLLQLKRSESLLRQLFQYYGFNLPLKGYVIFINPNFTLYQAPLNQPIIYPTQLEQFINTLNRNPSKLSEKHRNLVEKLLSLHLTESRYSQIPKYEYSQVKKGIVCGACGSFFVTENGYNLLCGECGCIEKLESAVLRSVNEFKLLFPDRKVTTNQVFEWCRVVRSKRRIYEFLKQNYRAIGKKKHTYYK